MSNFREKLIIYLPTQNRIFLVFPVCENFSIFSTYLVVIVH